MASYDDEDELFQDLYGDDDRETLKKPEINVSVARENILRQSNGNETSKYDSISDEEGAVSQTSSVEYQNDALENYTDSNEAKVQEYDEPSSKEDGKMFIGGLNWDTTDETLLKYFSQFGDVLECQVMRDPATGKSRGFGFLTFRDSKCVNTVMVKEHVLDGKIIDPKRAIPKDEQEKTSKIFVGGIAPNVTEMELRNAFAPFGRILDTSLMIDKETGRSRGFGFITFDSDAGVENTVANCPLVIGGKMVEVKKAQPRGRDRFDQDSVEPDRGHHQAYDDGYQADSASGDYAGGQSDGYYQSGMSESMLAKYWHSIQAYMIALQQLQTTGTASYGLYGSPAQSQPQQQQQRQPPQPQFGRGHEYADRDGYQDLQEQMDVSVSLSYEDPEDSTGGTPNETVSGDRTVIILIAKEL